MTKLGKIVVLVALFISNQSLGLKQLPEVEENDIAKTEAAIRNTTNALFAIFHLQNSQDHPKIKQYAAIHKYFISLTLQDYDSLKEIAKLTVVDKKKIGNVTADFIALLNEILDEDNVVKIEHVVNGEVEGGYDITDELGKIEYMKNMYMDPAKVTDINEEILKLLEDDASPESLNVTSTSETPLLYLENETISESDGIWKPLEPVPTRRIYAGYTTKIHHYAFMASVQIFGKFQCGSSIIKSDLVITAASCLQLAWNNRFYRENPAFLSVRVGSSYYESGGDNIAILEVYFYPSYNPKNLNNNLALMRTIRHIVWKRRTKRVELDTNAHALPLNSDGVVIVGWGAKTSSNRLQSPFYNKIHYSVLDVYPLEDCQDIYSKEYVTRKNFCAGFISKGNGACNRDVGGPGIVGGYLSGVISFGAPVCGTPDAPTVFTKIGYYTDWIEEIMEKDVPTSKKKTTLLPHTYVFFPEKRKNETDPSEWTVSPVVKVKGQTSAMLVDQKQKNIVRNLDRNLFKDFLKTMFNSDEIQEYLDTMRETLPSIARVKTTEPVAAAATNPTPTFKDQDAMFYQPDTATRMQDADELKVKFSSDEDMTEALESATSIVEKETSPLKLEAFTEGIPVNAADSESGQVVEMAIPEVPVLDSPEDTPTEPGTGAVEKDLDKDLEERILKLVKDVASGEASTINYDRNKSGENNKAANAKREKDEEVVKDKIDEAILTLLYLSDGEQNKSTSLSKLIDADNQEEVEEANEAVTKKVNARERKKPAVPAASSSDYESETVELQIPVRSTAILETYEYHPPKFPAKRMRPKMITPKMATLKTVSKNTPQVFPQIIWKMPHTTKSKIKLRPAALTIEVRIPSVTPGTTEPNEDNMMDLKNKQLMPEFIPTTQKTPNTFYMVNTPEWPSAPDPTNVEYIPDTPLWPSAPDPTYFPFPQYSPPGPYGLAQGALQMNNPMIRPAKPNMLMPLPPSIPNMPQIPYIQNGPVVQSYPIAPNRPYSYIQNMPFAPMPSMSSTSDINIMTPPLPKMVASKPKKPQSKKNRHGRTPRQSINKFQPSRPTHKIKKHKKNSKTHKSSHKSIARHGSQSHNVHDSELPKHLDKTEFMSLLSLYGGLLKEYDTSARNGSVSRFITIQNPPNKVVGYPTTNVMLPFNPYIQQLSSPGTVENIPSGMFWEYTPNMYNNDGGPFTDNPMSATDAVPTSTDANAAEYAVQETPSETFWGHNPAPSLHYYKDPELNLYNNGVPFTDNMPTTDTVPPITNTEAAEDEDYKNVNYESMVQKPRASIMDFFDFSDS